MLLELMGTSLDPLLIKLQGEKPSFAVTLRICRLVFLLVRSFAHELPLQVETHLLVIVHMAEGEGWQKALALEVIRGICADAATIEALCKNAKVFSKIISVGRIRAAELGAQSDMRLRL
jgi:hypothetical protein